jgi:hypothetical protein
MESFLQFPKLVYSALTQDLIPALKNFCPLIITLFRRVFCPKRDGVRRKTCTHVAHPAFKRADPMIYDQYYLMSLGLAVSWQNPDIQILQNGVPVASAYDLEPATTYTIRAVIYNASTTGIVYNMPVEFSYLSFGAGTVSNPIPGPYPTVDLGVKGTPEGIAIAELDWTTPATPGHYCIQVSFSWPDDLNPANNLGQENTQVVQAASPAPFSFQLRNAHHVPRQFRFEVDTFEILPPPPCPATEPVRQRNSPTAHPLPDDWSLSLTPDTAALDPGEEITINGVIDPPGSFHGTAPVNIHVFSEAGVAGGLTVLVNRA